jgi:sugar fermentation stimulation protein A
MGGNSWLKIESLISATVHFSSPLIPGTLIRRYQRFLADVRLDNGETVVAHCPNTGSMMGCKEPGCRVWLSESDNPNRKLRYTWELVESLPDVWVGIHTGRSNYLVEEAILSGTIAELSGYKKIRREVKFGQERSRVDLLLTHDEKPDCYVEVKNVTAAVENCVAIFPDAVSDRGSKHLRELMAVVKSGQRAALVFCVQREDVTEVRPADEIDPVYGRTLRDAITAGVEVLAYRARVSSEGISITESLPVVCVY